MEDLNNSSHRNKLSKLLLTATGIVCMTAVLGWLVLSNTDTDQEPVVEQAGREPRVSPTASSTEVLSKTVGKEWQWDNFAENAESKAEADKQKRTPAPFDVPFIYEALQDVRLDEQGDVVVDDEALKALDKALNFSGIELSPADLEELQALIRIGLPGPVGGQTAEVVGNYYRFLEAEKEFNELYRAPGMDANVESGYEELIALRELYLGPEVAAKLFEKQDQDARYMLQSMLLARDESLTAEEREARQKKLAAGYHSESPDVPQWEERYGLFQYEQQAIAESTLSEDEKDRQIQQLLQQHFTADEIPAVKDYLEGR
jgi:hypothetical protein